jgi:putative ABC transport system permease protein
MRDQLRFATRSLRKSPAFTVSALLTLAIGIGGSTAMFTVVDAVLLRDAPYPEAERIVVVTGTNAGSSFEELTLSYPNFADLRDQSLTFEKTGAWTSYGDTRLTLTGGQSPEDLQYALATADFFEVLGVRAARGRLFRAEEDEPGTAPVVVISHGFWQRRFGGEADVIGREIVLDGVAHDVIGVLPREFRFATYPRDAEVWLPFGLDPIQGRRFSRGTNYVGVVARLIPSVDLTRASADAERIATDLERAYPYENRGDRLRVTPMREQAVSHLRRALLTLLAAVGLVLLISCANVANLQLARLPARQHELAVHAALGARRASLIRRLALENLLLATIGGGLGVVFAAWIADLILLLPSAPTSPFVPYRLGPGDVALDPRMLTFALALSILTAVLFGTAPALRASAANLKSMLGGRAESATARGTRLRDVLVVAEVALALVLLVGAGLLAGSYARLRSTDPGFQPENVLAADLNLSRAKYAQPDRMTGFHRAVTERLRGTPGVVAAGAIDVLPLAGTDQASDFYIEGVAFPQDRRRPEVHNRTVVPGYFETMRIPIARGRTLTREDRAGRRVVVINESFARRFFAGEDPIGKRLGLGYEAFVRFDPVAMRAVWDSTGALREIVGVVRDVRSRGIAAATNPELYVPYDQAPRREMSVVIRSTLESSAAATALRQAIAQLDPDQPISSLRSMEDVRGDAVSRPRMETQFLSVFAAIALLLAVVGVFGVAAYNATQRTKEIGIRIALGGTARDVATLVLRRAFGLALIGSVVGAAVAWWSTRALAAMLFGIGPRDPLTFAGAAALALVAALLASWLPARRAARLEPMLVLRQE